MAHGGRTSTQIKSHGSNSQPISSGATGGGGASNARHPLGGGRVEVCAYTGDINSKTINADVIICPIAGSLDLPQSQKDPPTLVSHVVKVQPKIQSFLEKVQQTDGGLGVGEVLVYDPKLCGSQKVIFATGPIESDYVRKDECYTDLKCTFTNCFEAAANLSAAIVAVPAISSGAGGMDILKVVQILADTLADFLQDYERRTQKVPGTLRKIIFVTLQKNVALEFEKNWKDIISGARNPSSAGVKLPSSSAQNSSGSSSRHLTRQSIHDKNSPRKNSSNSASSQAGAACSSSSAYQAGAGAGVGAASRSKHSPTRMETDDDDDDEDDDSSQHSQIVSRTDTDKDAKPEENCPICLEDIAKGAKMEIPGCKHVLCRDCFAECTQRQPVCPICRKPFGIVIGDQPEDAKMTSTTIPQSLPGYKRCGTIVINYTVNNGIQTKDHPHPGQPYQGTARQAFLPDTPEGRKVLKLLEKAFKSRLIFTIGSSVTTGIDNVVTWNDIHHKTNMRGGPQRYGYPDESYLERVTADLAAKGIV